MGEYEVKVTHFNGTRTAAGLLGRVADWLDSWHPVEVIALQVDWEERSAVLVTRHVVRGQA